jgi:threonine synthase
MALLNSINPHRLEGQKTAAFEVIEQLGGAPDWLALPVGNGGNITAYWKGFGESGVAPRMLAGQAAGAAPLVTRAPVPNPTTVATAIRIGNPARLDQALEAVEQSRGGIRAIPDEGILAAYRLLAQEEGVFCEPASAASVAALLEAARDGLVEPGARVVCVLTGHGLKDPDTAGQEGAEIMRCPPAVERLEELAFAEEPALV